MKKTLASAIATAAILGAKVATAHQPTISDGTALDAESALFLDDIQLSRVIYQKMTDASPTLWVKFEINKPQELYVSLGMPLLARLAAYRPAFAVLGPGLEALEEDDLPFETPPDMGGLVFRTDDVENPVVFNEPFSGTRTWILREENVALPEAGTYFIVAYHPSGETGKLWLAPGDREEFGPDAFAGLGSVLRDVRAFHEVSGGFIPCVSFPLAVVLPAFAALWFVRRKRRVINPPRIEIVQ